jgi:3-deoxy-manno-octulosonate cytidylyltransferase (CMP-KDO synthetase)
LPSQKVLAVIPARYGSTRFRGKPLAPIAGVPMILRVYRRARRIRGVDEVVVATDDRRIVDVVERDGGTACITSKAHRTGTSRVLEVASSFEYGIVLNIQGDEPLLPVRCAGRLVDMMRGERGIVMGTLAARSNDLEGFRSPDVVKVVCDRERNALYFSRSPLPSGAGGYLRHIGVYAFRLEFLARFCSLGQGPLEKRERLEQLRALENGYRIRVVTCRCAGLGVDRPEDIKRVEKWLRRN